MGVRRRRLLALTIAAAGVLAVLTPVATPRADARPGPLPTVIGTKVLGHSLGGRAIVAYHLGNPHSRIKAVVLGQMHGDEHAGVVVASAIIHGAPVKGIDLWVIPTMNPDGNRWHRRANNHGVDLNRNWPDIWVPLTGLTYSGPRPLSEPETRIMYGFLSTVRPTLMVSLHQPLYGVDTTDGGARNPAFRNRLAHNLGLPLKAFRCWSVCHGSMTGWITSHQRGSAITVEYGHRPTSAQLTRVAPRGIIRAFGGSYDSLAAHTPVKSVTARASGSTVRISGWAWDPDLRSGSIGVRVSEGSAVRWEHPTSVYRPDVNRVFHLTGNHGFVATLTAPNGTHLYCVLFGNVGPGNDLRWCTALRVDGSPSGHLDAVSSPIAGSARVSGWMFDPDAKATSGQVRVSVDGVLAGVFPADLPRPDVNQVYRLTGDHGFAVTLDGQSDGTHRYCASAVNFGPPAADRDLGCADVAVAAGPAS